MDYLWRTCYRGTIHQCLNLTRQQVRDPGSFKKYIISHCVKYLVQSFTKLNISSELSFEFGPRLRVVFSNNQPTGRYGARPPPGHTSTPLKPLFTVAQGDRRHGNIPLEFIPGPITWETSKSQTKKDQDILKWRGPQPSPYVDITLGMYFMQIVKIM